MPRLVDPQRSGFLQYVALVPGDALTLVGYAKKPDRNGFDQVFSINGGFPQTSDGALSPEVRETIRPVTYRATLMLWVDT